MSISGNLVDVTVADVMQFVHLGGRTGTLSMKRSDQRAEVGFHRGRIISAWTPESKRLGDLLLEIGAIEETVLMEALARQDREVPKVSLGKILVLMGAVTKDQLRDAIADQIEHTIYDLVTWTSGEFDFALNELRPVDDIAVYPGDVLPDINLNTQILVLEALRIFDEKNRDLARSEAENDSSDEIVTAEAVSTSPVHDENDVALERLVSGSAEEGVTEESAGEDRAAEERADDASSQARGRLFGEGKRASKARFQIVSQDKSLIETLREQIPEDEAALATVALWDSGLTLPGESPPVVLLDLRDGAIEFSDFESYCRGRANASILAIASSPASAKRLYEAGALAAVPPESEAIRACLASVLRSRSGRARIANEQFETNAGFAKLRRVVADLRSGLMSATVALSLMQVISESVERAVVRSSRRAPDGSRSFRHRCRRHLFGAGHATARNSAQFSECALRGHFRRSGEVPRIRRGGPADGVHRARWSAADGSDRALSGSRQPQCQFRGLHRQWPVEPGNRRDRNPGTGGGPGRGGFRK